MSEPIRIIVRLPRPAAVRAAGMAMQDAIPDTGFAPGGAKARAFADKVGRQSVQSDYWSGTEFNTNNAWDFNFDNGNQDNDNKDNNNYGWAVRPG